MDTPQRVAHGRRIWISILVAGVVVVGGLTSAAPASAHAGSGETEVGSQLVLQALGHLAHDMSSSGVEASMEKIGDVLKTKDQAGVNVAEVKQAKAALEAGQVVKGRDLLQHSITAANATMTQAVGEETGTKVVPDGLPGRGGLGATGMAFLAVSLLFLLFGGGLAYYFRPGETVGQLRKRLGSPGHPQPATSAKDAS